MTIISIIKNDLLNTFNSLDVENKDILKLVDKCISTAVEEYIQPKLNLKLKDIEHDDLYYCNQYWLCYNDKDFNVNRIHWVCTLSVWVVPKFVENYNSSKLEALDEDSLYVQLYYSRPNGIEKYILQKRFILK